jgi:single-strand DNA-binding protein
MTKTAQAAQAATPTATNVVALTGRLTAAPEERTLPSGDVIATFRLSVPRQDTPMSRGSKQTTDWVDCVAFAARPRRTVGSWQVGDEVAVDGALRRRFYRTAAGASTRLEVEVLRARRLTRAPEGRAP